MSITQSKDKINEIREKALKKAKKVAPTIQEKPNPGEFWYQKLNKKGEPYWSFNEFALAQTLENAGFGYAMLDKNNPCQLTLICVQGYIVEETSIAKIQTFAKSIIENADIDDEQEKQAIITAFTRQVHILISQPRINLLHYFSTFQDDCRPLCFLKDDKQVARFPFKNGLVEVTKDGIALKKLDCHVWRSQILQHEFCPVSQDEIENFEFYKFLRNTCTDRKTETLDIDRFESLLGSIGYLLHDFKTGWNKKALILSESSLDEDPQGRTGKGLIMQAIAKLRKTVTLDGRTFSFDSQFCYQNVSLDTKILFFDDVKPRFDFRKLFSAITEGLSFERKNKDRVNLPVEESPKIAISTNYAIQGNSESDKGRKHEMELLTYYSTTHRPVDEFGHNFFDDWKKDDWICFFNLMFLCIKKYLTTCNISTYKSSILAEKRLLQGYSQEFIDFCNEIERGKYHTAKDLLENFRNGLDKQDQKIWTQKRFRKGLTQYAAFAGCKFTATRETIGNERLAVYRLDFTDGI